MEWQNATPARSAFVDSSKFTEAHAMSRVEIAVFWCAMA
jgi:hypothetical protein